MHKQRLWGEANLAPPGLMGGPIKAPLDTIMMFEGFQKGTNFVLHGVMGAPLDTILIFEGFQESLSDSCTPDRCTFSSLGIYLHKKNPIQE